MKNIKYYFAPMEGITTFTYRVAHAKVYKPLDKYFIPFIEPHEKRDFKNKELQEILPENNEGIYAVPQILTNRAEGFIKVALALQKLGYQEINLNVGCPSKTVSSKYKGAGFLARPQELLHFLEEIFTALDLKISIKTRIGRDNPEEFYQILEIYNKFPLEELIIHPRIQTDYYKNTPRMEYYQEAIEKSTNPLCYNGDLFTSNILQEFYNHFPEERRLMLGRGLILNPGLLCHGTKEQLQEFHELLLQGYLSRGMEENNILYKMKELWFYQIHLFQGAEKYEKKIKKAQKLIEYRRIVEEVFDYSIVDW